MSRTAAREVSMKYIYAMEVNKLWNEDMKAIDRESEAFDGYVNDDDDIVVEDMRYIERTIEGVKKEKSEIDKLIEENSKSWKLNRFSKIDLSILRIAVYEILYAEDIPHQVSINEAVRIAKKYSAEESSKFINGILGGIVRSLGIS